MQDITTDFRAASGEMCPCNLLSAYHVPGALRRVFDAILAITL